MELDKLYKKHMKRILDVFFSVTLIIFLSPLLIIISLLILLTMGFPIIFIQSRPGKDCHPFKMYKFRTMTNESNENGIILDDKSRLTFLGKILRATSLDELPELFNVLKGDMSFVGPRPLLMEYLELYNTEQIKRHNVKPGITGLAQVKGRNSLSWEEKFEYDLQYIHELSFTLDIKIMVNTLFVVLKKEGITDGKSATTSKFKGTK